MTSYKQKLLFDEQAIADRVEQLARDVSAAHPEGPLVFVGILKGSFMFMADLVRAVNRPCEIDFARISSYGSSTSSSGKLNVIMDVGIPLKDRAVFLVDDIVDTGLTLSEYRKHLEAQSPVSLETVALIDKTGRRERRVDVDHYGFRIEDGFVVGYGLDFDENYRNLPAIYVLEEK